MKTVSVCMIAKNESKCIRTALESARLLADEILVLDTGSTDDTMAIAREMGARVWSGGDDMDNGGSRNEVIEKATGDWIVILDCDERIADPVGLRVYLQTVEVDSIYVRTTYMDKNDKPTLSFSQQRIWRRGSFIYKFRSHELPVLQPGYPGTIARTDFVWEHRPPMDRTWKRQRTLKMLQMDLEDHPDDPRILFYLGRQFLYVQDYEQAICSIKKYLETPDLDAGAAWNILYECHRAQGNQQRALECAYLACASEPKRREWWGILANHYFSRGDYGTAAGMLKLLLEIQQKDERFSSGYWHGSFPHDLLARAFWKLGRYQEGQVHALEAVRIEPGNQRLVDNAGWFERKLREVNHDGHI